MKSTKTAKFIVLEKFPLLNIVCTYYSNSRLLSMGTYYPQLTSVQYHTIQLVGIIDGIKFDELAQSKKMQFLIGQTNIFHSVAFAGYNY